MNEARTIFRHCGPCGKDIEIKLSSKKHWWQKRTILEGGYFFFGDISRREMARGWTSKWIMRNEKYPGPIHQFLSDHIWWWSIPEAECSMANWKKPFYMLYWWIEDHLDPPETIEYWECPDCFHASEEKSKKEEEVAAIQE